MKLPIHAHQKVKLKCLVSKKLFSFLLLLPTIVFAQVQTDSQWKNAINPIFQHLDKSKIQSGILLDYAMEFTDVSAYNGILTDTTYINANLVGDIYKTLFMGKVVADTTHTPLFERYAYNWARDRFNATKDSTGVYILSGLLYQYQRLNENALANNKITVSNNKYYDRYSRGIWQNPYETLRTFALTPPTLHSRSKNVYFKLPSSLFLSNLDNQIVSIQLDADNGQGYQNLPFDSAIALEFYENKIHDLTFKISLSSGQVLYCRSKFKIDDPVLDISQQARGVIVVNDERIYIHEDGNFFNAAWVTVRRIPGTGSTGLTKPLIIAEGLDTGNFTAPEDFGGDQTLQDFQRSVNFGGNNLRDLIDEDRNHTYDLIYIDWVRGMADLRDNSRVLEEVIGWVNDQKALNGSTEQNVLLGQSMGGVIGRYTLARMENAQTNNPNAPDHDVRLFVAHDSPMQGANTPLSTLHFFEHMQEEYVSTPIAYLFFDVLIPVGLGLAQLGENFLNSFDGNNDNIPEWILPSQLLSLQDRMASRQLNYWSVLSGPFQIHEQTRSLNQSWQQTLENEGWPTQSRNIAISNGNECTAVNDFAPGAQLIDVNSNSNPGFLLDMMNAVLAPLVGALTFDVELFLIGAIPGRSRWETKFDFNTYGFTGEENRIYRGRLRFKKKILWIEPTATHDVFNRSYYAPDDALTLDIYSGGTENLQNFADDLPSFLPSIDFINPEFGFIPVVSALDIKKTNGDQPTANDYRKSYSGGLVDDPTLVSGFDAFIVDNVPNQPFNNEHISFQPRNGNWLADELEAYLPGNNLPVLDNCSFVCENTELIGPETICNLPASYTAPVGGTTYTWSVFPSSIATFSSNNTNTVTVNRNGNASGWIIVQVVMSSNRCLDDLGNPIFATYRKDVYVGAPTVESITEIDPNTILHISSGDGNCPDIGLELNFAPSNTDVLEVEWEKVTLDVLWSRDWSNPNDRYVILYPNCNKDFQFRVRARNSCGWSDWQDVTYTIDSCARDCGGGSNNGGVIHSNYYEIYPVPASTSLTAEIKSVPEGTIDPNLNFSIQLFNSSGALVFNTVSSLNPTTIDVSTYTTGYYTLVLSHAGYTESHQIIIN